jgi:hypothetical protein
MSGTFASFTILAVAALAPLVSAQHQPMPPGMSHEEHLKQMSQESEMKKRGNLAMGFDQEKVSHHFHLTRTGGSIEVGVNQDADEVTLKQIRNHLKTISQEFRDGIFTSPIATHGEVPPGVSVLRERKARITYSYKETPDGARVIISTTDRTARASLHDFLKYQIREHATGDPVSVQK